MGIKEPLLVSIYSIICQPSLLGRLPKKFFQGFSPTVLGSGKTLKGNPRYKGFLGNEGGRLKYNPANLG